MAPFLLRGCSWPGYYPMRGVETGVWDRASEQYNARSTRRQPQEARSTVRLFAAVGLAFLVMLPRLGSPQFGLLDDGLTLQTGHAMSGRWSSVLHLIPETGRFFPAYWLVYSAIVGIVGVRPLGFFAVNVLLLAGLIAILVRLMRLGGGTRGQAGAAAVLFALSGPAVEAFYTLSKAEPWQLTWIGLSLLLTAASAIDARSKTRAALMVLAAAALLLAHATKETSIILLPIALGWLAMERWSPNRGSGAGVAGTNRRRVDGRPGACSERARSCGW